MKCRHCYNNLQIYKVCFVAIENPCSYFSSVGLKHVSDDQKTHKNANLRFQATPIKTKTPEAVNSPRAAVQKRPPLLELEGKKWRVVCEINHLLSRKGIILKEESIFSLS